MARRQAKHLKAAAGFLVDENLAPAVSDFIAVQGYRVAHIGREAEYLLPAPATGTKDPMLKSALQSLILITKEQGFLDAGAVPNHHRGIFVIEASNATLMDVVRRLFAHVDWKQDPMLRGRRFLVSIDRCTEIAPDGSQEQRWW
jgi:hypothetical protein